MGSAHIPVDRFTAKIRRHTPLSAEEQEALVKLVSRPVFYPSGATIADVGDLLDIATIPLEGLIGRSKSLGDGRRQILAVLLPGDFVDAQASVMRHRTDSLEALDDSKVAIIPQSRIEAVAAAFPRLREAFLREAFLETAITREWVLNIGRRTAVEGLAHLLCELTVRMDAVGLCRDGRYPFRWRQQQLADALGLSAIHLNRVIQELRRSGCIRLDRETLEILDRDRLCAVAGFDGTYLEILGVDRVGEAAE